jgi:hypothetical protein
VATPRTIQQRDTAYNKTFSQVFHRFGFAFNSSDEPTAAFLGSPRPSRADELPDHADKGNAQGAITSPPRLLWWGLVNEAQVMTGF